MLRKLDWLDALRAVPEKFSDNGCSSPFRRFHERLYSVEVRSAIAIAARLHDCGFGPFRLTGSGFEQFVRAEWNGAYCDCMTDQNCPTVGELHHSGLIIGSRGPWNQSWHEMEKAGWKTWDDFLDSTVAEVITYRCAMQAAWAEAA